MAVRETYLLLKCGSIHYLLQAPLRNTEGSMDLLAAMATFVRAVDAGSLSAAARSLPSSLTSVSRQISALEQHFGTRLLLRTTRQLALTDDGRILYERAKSILGELRDVEATL